MRSFRKAIYESIIVTAMEMARLLCGGPYHDSYRYTRDSVVNLVRGARWDVFPYTKIGASAGSVDTQKSKMVVICIPPWELSKLDFQEFSVQMTVSTGQAT